MQGQVTNQGGGGIMNLFGGVVANAMGIGNKTKETPSGPTKIHSEEHLDDHNFCRNYDGLNIIVTGATGTILTKRYDFGQITNNPIIKPIVRSSLVILSVR